MPKNPKQLRSFLTEDFFDTYDGLPQRIKDKVKDSYKLWESNNFHPSLKFKPILPKQHVWSVRILGNEGYRALGIVEGDGCYWFWVGTHDDYMREIGNL